MTALRSGGGRVAKFRVSTSKAVGGTINEAGCCNYLVGMTLGAIHVSQVPESGRPGPLRSLPAQALRAMRLVFLQSAIQNPKSRIQNHCVGPSAILTGSRTRPSDWGSNARFGPVENRRNNRRLAALTREVRALVRAILA